MLLKKEFTVLCGKNSYIYSFFFSIKANHISSLCKNPNVWLILLDPRMC